MLSFFFQSVLKSSRNLILVQDMHEKNFKGYQFCWCNSRISLLPVWFYDDERYIGCRSAHRSSVICISPLLKGSIFNGACSNLQPHPPTCLYQKLSHILQDFVCDVQNLCSFGEIRVTRLEIRNVITAFYETICNINIVCCNCLQSRFISIFQLLNGNFSPWMIHWLEKGLYLPV